MSKASELAGDLMSRNLTPEETDKRNGKRPALQLRPDMPSTEIEGDSRVQGIISRLENENIGSVALRDSHGPAAVIMPVDRYLELVGKELANDPSNKVATLDGRIMPTETAFAKSYVEQVDPDDEWILSV